MNELQQVQIKYPHVIEIHNIELDEFQYSTARALTEMPSSRMTQRLIEKIEEEIITGKRKFKFYEIECNNCARTRVIKLQDAFQVKNCGECKKPKQPKKKDQEKPEKVQEKAQEVAGDKKPAKLTKPQEKLIADMKRADYSYRAPDGKLLNHYAYFNGEKAFSNIYTGSYVMGKNLVSTRVGTGTIRSLEKKGVIRIVKDGTGGDLDLVELIGHEFHAPIEQMKEIVVLAQSTYASQSDKCDATKTEFKIYCLPEDNEEMTIEAYFKNNGNWEYVTTISIQIFKPEIFNI